MTTRGAVGTIRRGGKKAATRLGQYQWEEARHATVTAREHTGHDGGHLLDGRDRKLSSFHAMKLMRSRAVHQDAVGDEGDTDTDKNDGQVTHISALWRIGILPGCHRGARLVFVSTMATQGSHHPRGSLCPRHVHEVRRVSAKLSLRVSKEWGC